MNLSTGLRGCRSGRAEMAFPAVFPLYYQRALASIGWPSPPVFSLYHHAQLIIGVQLLAVLGSGHQVFAEGAVAELAGTKGASCGGHEVISWAMAGGIEPAAMTTTLQRRNRQQDNAYRTAK